MADLIVIQGSDGLDGSYELEVSDGAFTTHEWRWIKQLSGYLPLTVDEGFRGGDPDLIVAFAVIALVRAGKVAAEQVLDAGRRLADMPFDGEHIQYTAEPEDVTDPPPGASGAEQSSLSNGSGDGSTTRSGSQGSDRSPIGSRGSARSAAFAPATFET